MTPEQRQQKLKALSPDHYKDMMRTLGLSPLQLDKGDYDTEQMDAFLLGNYGFTSSQEGRHLITTPKPQTVKQMAKDRPNFTGPTYDPFTPNAPVLKVLRGINPANLFKKLPARQRG